MGFLTTEKCCGILSLRTGGLILGWTPLMLSILEIYESIKSNQPEFTGAFAVLALLLVFWIQGITHKKSAWMFPMVIFWNVALWAEIIIYAISFYYHVFARSKHPKFQTTHQEMLIMPLATMVIWHFAAVCYSLYKKIDDENRYTTTTTVHLQRTTAETATAAATATQPPPPPQQQQQSPPTVVISPPTPPPSYDRIYKV